MAKTVYIETYGCRMNIYDSELVLSILTDAGYGYTADLDNADVIILNSCSVREDGHKKIYERLCSLEKLKNQYSDKILIIAGCFASFLNESLFAKYPFVDIIVNPNCYRDLPEMIKRAEAKEKQVSVMMDNEEVYNDITPVRYLEDATTAAIVVMKGCNQHCSYCIETYTRGKEQSRSAKTIVNEAIDIARSGYREITLVGHIIDKYLWEDSVAGQMIDFARLLDMVAKACPDTRVKFLSSHPAFLNDRIVDVIANNENIMRVVHLPLQSGSNRVLQKMNRGYTVESFVERVQFIRKKIADISIITDIIVGFCSESENDFRQTEETVERLEFDDINVFQFSLRQHTKAFEQYVDDVAKNIKAERAAVVSGLNRLIRESKYRNAVGLEIQVIAEGKRDKDSKWYGRDKRHRTVVFDSAPSVKINDTVTVRITDYNSYALFGTGIKIN